MNLSFHHSYFEDEVRTRLNLFDRPVTEEDALRVTELDLHNFDFMSEDMDTLFLFRNLKVLDICAHSPDPERWRALSQLKYLYFETGGDVNLEAFRGMKHLTELYIDGMFTSGPWYNPEALTGLKKLRKLFLGGRSGGDLSFLASMPQLRQFVLQDAFDVKNVEAIAELQGLRSLRMNSVTLDSLGFLDRLPDSVRIDLCGVLVRGGVNPENWKRFTHREISEISANSDFTRYIDLSVLDS